MKVDMCKNGLKKAKAGDLVCVKGGDFYLVTSSREYPLYHIDFGTLVYYTSPRSLFFDNGEYEIIARNRELKLTLNDDEGYICK